MRRVRSIGSLKAEMVTKAKESALCAIKVFNDPLIKFKSEAFIVLMVIAWTYLLHAYYRSKGIDYRYFKQNLKRKTYDKTRHGAKKHWELERCLGDAACPVDKDTINNLKFLIDLRHEIEHQMTRVLDNYLSGRYQACVLNFNYYLKKLFGLQHALDTHLTYSIQFVELTAEQFQLGDTLDSLPHNLRTNQFGNKGTLMKIITLHPLVIVVEGFYASASDIKNPGDVDENNHFTSLGNSGRRFLCLGKRD